MSALTSLLAWFRKGEARRSASRSLHRLSVAELADLGIPPDRIDDVVDEMLMMTEHCRDCAVSARPRRGPREAALPRFACAGG